MTEKLLSVSVAAYNLGDMIKENIESFVQSPARDRIELLVTDDGSRDNTADIVAAYAEKYPDAVRLIRQENRGPGSTVNSGIAHATGKYFRMVDGDDWVDTATLADFIAFLAETEADMIVSAYEIFSDREKRVIDRVAPGAGHPEGPVPFAAAAGFIPAQMHAVTFRTAVFREMGRKMDNGFYTDTEYLLFPIPYVKTVAFFDGTVYVYRVARAGQSVNEESMKRNCEKHLAILKVQTEVYNSVRDSLSPAKRQFLIARIAKMADVQLGTYLLFDGNRENKARTRQFLCTLKKDAPDIYAGLRSQSKKCKLLVYSRFLAYPLARELLLKKGRREY